MAAWLTRLKAQLENTVWGAIPTAVFYAILLLLIFLFFTGNGEFLYGI